MEHEKPNRNSELEHDKQNRIDRMEYTTRKYDYIHYENGNVILLQCYPLFVYLDTLGLIATNDELSEIIRIVENEL